MPLPIEEYAIIGDTQTVALVGSNGAIDWLCLPRFDSDACFAALLGNETHGRWSLAPRSHIRQVRRRYRGDSLILETDFITDAGTVRLIDCMPPRGSEPDVVRVVEGIDGEVPMRMELVPRFDYGSIVPWVLRRDASVRMIAGPDGLALWASVPTGEQDGSSLAEFTIAPGQRQWFVLAWHHSHEAPPPPIDAGRAIAETQDWWEAWVRQCTYEGPWRDAVVRSLVTLKALTYAPTGAVIAAATTSLPEKLGGVRNWDYRYCWLRDATLTLYALLGGGYEAEAHAWRDWLLRAVAGDPSKLQIMYGPGGERRLTEYELPWLPGYEGSSPVRVGNAAVDQLQLDVYGEVLDALFQARRAGMPLDADAWALQRALVDFLCSAWREPDEGIWEVRGPRRHFTHSKVLAWVAVDRAIKTAERLGLNQPLEEWRALRGAIHDEVCTHGFDPRRNTFTQSYGSRELDASLLIIPMVGFLSPKDPRVVGTVDAIERDLIRDGFVLRYRTDTAVDGLPPGEGVFLACSFWLADNYQLIGRHDEARRLFERLLDLRNDVGLLSEQYDPAAGRLVGNFPQAFSHVALVNTARNLTRPATGPTEHRREA
jgi:GH15 family glucan-1,4-alpha-glucosidase